jgi:signal transduction histidine kinase
MTHIPPLPPIGAPMAGTSAAAASDGELATINGLLRARLDELESANARLRDQLRSSETLREEAERANQSKDEFIATVSHELRTPLNTIRLWSRMLAEGKLSEGDAVQGAKVLERSVLAQQKLVEDLLDVSRMSRELQGSPADCVTGSSRLRRFAAVSAIICASADAPRANA